MSSTTTISAADAGAADTSSNGHSSTSTAPPMPMMLQALQSSLGHDLLHKIQHESNILVVGAGGIGCELLKNLALCGFTKVTVIDLDTIDVSNLNRQLLFRSNHVGHPKCVVACQVASSQLLPVDDDNDNNNKGSSEYYKAIHGNVCDPELFSVPFVSQFDVVLSALDNVTARRRVNRLCLAAKNGDGVPLVEAGTTGYLGQVSVITRSVECYECRPQEPPKVYPICTIRSTPSAPVHTIVWAKECYKLLFHPKLEESMLYEAVDEVEHNDKKKGGAKRDDDDNEADGDREGEGGGYEPSVYMDAVIAYRNALSDTGGGRKDDDITKLAGDVLRALYCDEISKQLNMNRYKTARKTPVAMSSEACDTTGAAEAPTAQSSGWSTTQVWSQQQCASEFVHCLLEAHDRMKATATSNGKNDNGSSDLLAILPEFDKDDDLSMRFVTAASNLRSYVFGIEPIQSYYSAKGIAGNIIPAIATTNAIVAGLQILQTFHILKAQLEGRKATDPELVEPCRYVNCVRQASRNGLLLIASALEKPNPNCYVCRSATLHVQLTLSNWTLRDFLDKILKGHLGFVEPALFLDGNGIWEEEEDDFVPNLAKKLEMLPCGGIRHGTVVLVEDYSQDMSVEVVVSNCDAWPKEKSDDGDDSGQSEPDPFKFVVGGSKPKAAAAAPEAATAAASDAHTNGDSGSMYAKAAVNGGAEDDDDDDDDDDIIEVVDEDPSSDKKRASPDEATSLPPLKKRKGHDVSGVIEID